MIILTEKIREFPKLDAQIYEPEGNFWMTRPAFTDPDDAYWKQVHGKCQPLSR